MSVLVYAEHDNASLKDATLAVVTAAAKLGEVHVLVAGSGAKAAADAAAKVAGVAKVLLADDGAYANQLSASDGIVSAYREQFTIGQRSLLDVLDAQNTRFNVQVQAETANFSARFAEYRLLAATGSLLSYLDVSAPKQSDAYARDLLDLPSVEDNGTVPERDLKPVTLNGKLSLSKYAN